MTVANAAQRRRWNDARRVPRQLKWERLNSAVTPVLLDALALAPGERLLDIGCGAGAATLSAARLVGPNGTVVGADISEPLVRHATLRAARAGLRNVTFHVTDVQTGRLDGAPFTAAMSQFGVMFFDDPTAAFGNVRAHLIPSGRLCFACWQAADKNPWSYAALLSGLLTPAQPTAESGQASGPFTLADASRTSRVLRDAGFRDVDITPREDTLQTPEDAVFDDLELAIMGVPPARMTEARAIVHAHLARFRQPAGLIRLPLAYLIVTARHT